MFGSISRFVTLPDFRTVLFKQYKNKNNNSMHIRMHI